ncbi:MAG TPA: FAD-linked oxidase C-terminal domain-containing protein [Anaerolineae bacterium]|nr:FAD-linked oxidase C-terminal domain-containing protein [Anaerolineae bacterium]
MASKNLQPGHPQLLTELRAAIGAEAVATDPATLTAYAYDGTWAEQRPAVVLHPLSTQQVSSILRIADRERIPIVPRGAGTGLAGGSIPIEGSWCLNLARMNRLLSVSAADSIVVTQPGVITASLQKEVEKQNLFYPPDPASLHMCTIGGNVSTNAGGPRCLKYGVTADYVLGLEVVLPGGKIMRTGGQTIKNVSSYNITQLLVGSEGTLGVITEITLRLIPKPIAQATALASFDKLSDACDAVGKMLSSGITPLVTEIMDHDVIRAVDQFQRDKRSDLRLPIEAEALLLVAVDGDRDQVERDIDQVTSILKRAGSSDVRRANSPEEAEAMWEARRSVSPAVIRLGNARFGEDIVVPRSKIPQMVDIVKQIGKQQELLIVVYGHIGDGNLHPNIICDRRDAEMMQRVERAAHAIFDAALELGGTISGEHGIGLLKTNYVSKAIDPVALSMLQSIKKLFDPHNILNPGKKLPGSTQVW